MADRIRSFLVALIVVPASLLAMSGLARAATLTVTNINDTGAGSLRAEILAASSGDTINFGVSGTITLGSALPAIAISLTIDGSGQAITVDGTSMFQIFNVNSGATLNLRFLTLAHGLADANEEGEGAGGAIFNEGGILTVTNCTLSDSQSLGSAVIGNGTGFAGVGGAIWSEGMLTVTDSTFTGNRATGGAGASTGVGGGVGEGGAIFNEGAVTVTDSTFTDNQATGGVGDGAAGGNGVGGAILNQVGTVTVINSTFSANLATGGAGSDGGRGAGGAIFSGDTVHVTNATFSRNQATAGAGGGGLASGGAIENGGSSVGVKGTIFSTNTPTNCALGVLDLGHNISDDGSCGFTGTSINNSTTLNLDPAGLQNNGGPTNTIALEPNSQAVDFIPVADCTDQSFTPVQLTTDQRGFPRPDPGNPNFCDAGAFELQTMPVVISSSGERVQIARSTAPNSDQVNMAFTFTEIGAPTCDAADDAFNGFTVLLRTGSCGALVDDASLELMLEPWAVHTVNHQSYGTLFQSMPPETVSARMVQLPTPASPACGEWTVNIEVAGIDSSDLGDGPFALMLSNADGDTGCFDVTNAVVGNQIDPPTRTVRRGVRR